MTIGTLPAAQGLYDPANEHDACGVGFVANVKGRKSHEIVQQGLRILENLTHRGAVGADPHAGDGAVTITVEDTGVGIAPERLENIFEVGFTSGGDRVKVGWGLATVQQIVKRHGGEVRVSSRPRTPGRDQK